MMAAARFRNLRVTADTSAPLIEILPSDDECFTGQVPGGSAVQMR